MQIFIHFLIFLLAIGIMWVFSGILVSATDRVAKRFHQSGFTVSFFVLGFLTSITGLSVMVNALLENAPQIGAGNLIGAPFVILLFIIPFLAVVGNGVLLREMVNGRELLLALLVVFLPVAFVLDGNVTKIEGALCLLVYGTLFYFIQKKVKWWNPLDKDAESAVEVVEDVEKELIGTKHANLFDIFRILGGAFFIFVAGTLLVKEAVYFSGVLSIPSSFVGLVILSIGTNVPELVIAIRSVYDKHVDIAFGDYLGSAVANTLYFGLLALFTGGFLIHLDSFILTAIFLLFGLLAFYFFANSKNTISRKEGVILLSFYGFFILVELLSLFF